MLSMIEKYKKGEKSKADHLAFDKTENHVIQIDSHRASSK